MKCEFWAAAGFLLGILLCPTLCVNFDDDEVEVFSSGMTMCGCLLAKNSRIGPLLLSVSDAVSVEI